MRGEAREPGLPAHLDAGLGQAQKPGVEPVSIDVQIVAPVGLGAAAVPVVDYHLMRLRLDPYLLRHPQTQGSKGLLGVGGEEPSTASL